MDTLSAVSDTSVSFGGLGTFRMIFDFAAITMAIPHKVAVQLVEDPGGSPVIIGPLLVTAEPTSLGILKIGKSYKITAIVYDKDEMKIGSAELGATATVFVTDIVLTFKP